MTVRSRDADAQVENTEPGSRDAVPPGPSLNLEPRPAPESSEARYEMLSLLGQGGMGTVHKARDQRLHRFVALKFLQTERPSAVQRFQQEARAQARIDHEHVCKIYEVGTLAGKPYIAMEYIDGQPLQKVMSALRLEEKLCLMRDAAEALHAAHRLGIVHRDVKPSNILIQKRDDGTFRPVLMDFGLAHDLEAEQGLTRSGMVMGTPSYMPPEQARGDSRNVDRRTDVYALGATLFELLADRPPFEGENQAEVLLKTLNEEPPPLRALRPGLPMELETIVMKCLQKDPAQRYISARALAEDLRRYLNGEPILGKRSGLFYRLRRKAQKHRAVVAVALLALVALTALSIYGIRARFAVQREQAQAAARAQLSQQLGQNIKEMEWFVRSVHQLPPHDTRHAKQLLQTRMKKLGSLRHGLGEVGDGLLQYALGHGYFALKDFDGAYTHFSAAQRMGSDTPELRWALGRVLGEQYKMKLEEALRTGDVSFVKARKQELGEVYLKPALSLLRTSQGVDLASPQLLEGLVALYSEQYDEALQKAEHAIRQAPWLYEAQQLAGDVHFARGISLRNQADHDGAKQSFERAITQYKEAAEIGRSDEQLYEAIAESYIQWGDIATNLQQRLDETALYEKANAYCQKAMVIAPDRPHCYSKISRAYALILIANRISALPIDNIFADLLKIAQRGLAIDPNDAYIYDSLGNGNHVMALRTGNAGSDPTEYYKSAFANFNLALSKQPKFPISLTNLGYTYIDQSSRVFTVTGEVPIADAEQANRALETARAIDPYYEPAWINALEVHDTLIIFSSKTGRDPSAHVSQLLNIKQKMFDLNLKVVDTWFVIFTAMHYYVDYLLLKGDRHALDSARQQARAEAEQAEKVLSPDAPELTFVRLFHAVDEARILLFLEQDPTSAIRAGQAAAGTCSIDRLAHKDECLRLRSLLALCAADSARQRRQPFLQHLQQAIADVRPTVTATGQPDNVQQLVYAIVRLVEAQAPHFSAAIVAEGHRNLVDVLAIYSGVGEIYALRGRLHLAQAKAAATLQQRRAWAQKARDDFALAVRKNPLLARACERHIAETAGLLAQDPTTQR